MHSNLRTMDVAGYRDGEEMNLTGLGEPLRLHGTTVSANFFSLLGVQPEAGRGFLDGEDQPARDDVVILSHALSQQLFDTNPNLVRRSVMLGRVGRQIFGIMLPDYTIPS